MAKQTGYLEVIAGPMFSGKTEELIRRVKRASIGKKRVQVFKHAIDTRYGKEKKLYSHAGSTVTSRIIQHAHEILQAAGKRPHIIVIDEAQWLGDELIDVISTLVERNYHVIASGLALTYDRKPFHPMPTLMAMADMVTKVTAVCSLCGNDALFHKRIDAEAYSGNTLQPDPALVGTKNEYQPRCRLCFSKKP